MDCDEELLGPDDGRQPANWGKLTENVYLNEKKSCKNGKRDNKMQCDCEMMYENGEPLDGCGEDCINRMLMFECHPKLCPCGEFCQNQRFQKRQYADVEVFKAGKKGWGLRAKKDIPPGTFIREYVGEVCSNAQFQDRSLQYHSNGRRHHYFMTLRTDEIIDATMKGSISRFINHSCEPNCETQKWTVNGRLRVGFFTIASIAKGEELTFDYQFQRSGEGAQPCFCGAESCRGIIGGKQDRVDKNGDKVARSSTKKARLVSEDDELTVEIKSLRKGSSLGVNDPSRILPLSRLMVMADRVDHRLLVLETLLATHDERCLKMFMKLQGLSLLWSWMIDCDDGTTEPFASSILDVLAHLPVSNLNPLLDSKVLSQVKRWSSSAALGHGKAMDVPANGALPSTPVKSVAEPSDLHNANLPSNDALRHVGSDDDDLSKSPASPLDAKRSSSSDSGVESPGGSASSHGSLSENSAATASQVEDSLQAAAKRLLDKWSDLKEVYRIPKKPPSMKTETPKPPPAAPPAPAAPHHFPPAIKSELNSPWNRSTRKPRYPHHERDQVRRQSGERRWDSPYKNMQSKAPLQFLSKPPCPIVEAVVNASHKAPSINNGESARVSVSESSPTGHDRTPPPSSYNNYTPYMAPSISTAHSLLAFQAAHVMQPQSAVTWQATTTGQSSVLQHPLVIDDPGTPLSSRGEEEMECSSEGSADVDASPANLPSDWLYARDSEGRVYYYHCVSREPQWERPDEEFQPPLPADSDGEALPAPPPEDSADDTPVKRVEPSSRRNSSDGGKPESASKKRRRSGSSDGRPSKIRVDVQGKKVRTFTHFSAAVPYTIASNGVSLEQQLELIKTQQKVTQIFVLAPFVRKVPSTRSGAIYTTFRKQKSLPIILLLLQVSRRSFNSQATEVFAKLVLEPVQVGHRVKLHCLSTSRKLNTSAQSDTQLASPVCVCVRYTFR